MGKQFQDNNNRGGSNPRRGKSDKPFGRQQRQGDQGPPSFVIPYGTFVHRSQNNFLIKCTDPSRVPKFNRGVYLESKAKVGSVDEILGPVNSFFFSAKPATGINPDSFKEGQVFYMSPEDLLPMERFTQKQSGPPRGGPKGGRGQGRGQPFQQRGRGGGQRGGQRGGFGQGRGQKSFGQKR